ncbi:MFS monosaccharide transporter, putative [Metarhizium acridum CQMa 102]|uniref:MFS monosaccharide transporter, putative n=1 Tax=Metarhizium acridum (strain CQMa 102) TaxID=655827 RepID=E9DVB8_METAQ|nr:MFS monosaccharide transporter, putative [Metarhizium acridum CQMa 102]EFY92295.1 MFS monosaccharide transporter, putative [Metarhizium acridum CQMa 102]
MDKVAADSPKAEHQETDAVPYLSTEPYGPPGTSTLVCPGWEWEIIIFADKEIPGFQGIAASRYVAICASFSAIGGLLFGYDQGVISVILVMDKFLGRFEEVSDTASGAGFYKGLMTAMITLGAFIGALNQGWIADMYSRKYSIMIAVVIFTVGSSLQTASVDYAMLVTARLIGGVGIGMLSMVVPLYISEISPPEIRGTLLVLEEFSIVLGIVISFWITYGTQYIGSHWSWQLPFLLQIIPGLLLGFGAMFLPFSPRWLASKGRDEDALLNLAKLRCLPLTDPRVQREWMEIITESRFQNGILAERHPNLVKGGVANKLKLEFSTWMDCFKRGCWRRTHVGAGLMFFQQFVGINALIYYSPTLFGTMGLDHNMQLIMSGVLNVTQLIGVMSSLWTLDRYGRRKILLCGSVGMFVSHFVIAVLVSKFSSNWPAHKAEGWTSVAFLLFYMLAFGASWGPVPWAMPAEIFPSSLRAKGVSISTCSRKLIRLQGLITPPMVQNTGFGAYVFFAVFCFLSFAWTFYFVPETNGKTLEQMDDLFKDHSSTEELERKNRLMADTIRERTNGFVGA